MNIFPSFLEASGKSGFYMVRAILEWTTRKETTRGRILPRIEFYQNKIPNSGWPATVGQPQDISAEWTKLFSISHSPSRWQILEIRCHRSRDSLPTSPHFAGPLNLWVSSPPLLGKTNGRCWKCAWSWHNCWRLQRASLDSLQDQK